MRLGSVTPYLGRARSFVSLRRAAARRAAPGGPRAAFLSALQWCATRVELGARHQLTQVGDALRCRDPLRWSGVQLDLRLLQRGAAWRAALLWAGSPSHHLEGGARHRARVGLAGRSAPREETGVPHFALVTTDGDAPGAVELGRPDWPDGAIIFLGRRA